MDLGHRKRMAVAHAHPQSTHFFLSEELIIEILIRAHAKTLFRSKCVCKAWRALISDQSFINRFIKRSESLPPSISGFFYRINDIFHSDGGKTSFIDTTNTPPLADQFDKTLSFLGPIVVVHSDNGLLLCAEKPNDQKSWNPLRYIVCNPVTKQWIALPQAEHSNYQAGALLRCYNVDKGCPQKTEFKVICLLKEEHNLLEVERYCSETGKWTAPKVHYYRWYLREFNSITLFKECVYWIQEDAKIVVYDLEEEIIRFIVSQERDSSPRWAIHLGVSAGSLYFTERTQRCFLVWILVNGVEFNLHHSIETDSLISVTSDEISSRFCFKFLGFQPTEYKVVLVRISDYRATLYRLDKKRLDHVADFHPSVFCNCYLKIFPYSLPTWPTCISSVKNT